MCAHTPMGQISDTTTSRAGAGRERHLPNRVLSLPCAVCALQEYLHKGTMYIDTLTYI